MKKIEEEKAKALAEAEKAFGPARIIGHNIRLTASQAALVNGSASHALDYDDVNERMNGHPTVPVACIFWRLCPPSPIPAIAQDSF